MVFALLFTLYFAFCGLLLRALVFPKERGLRALWLGLVLGLFGLSWLPALFAFATGRFSLLENLLGALLMGLVTAAGLFLWNYYPVVQGTWHGWPVFGIYAALLALPLLLNWKEDHTWRVLQSNI